MDYSKKEQEKDRDNDQHNNNSRTSIAQCTMAQKETGTQEIANIEHECEHTCCSICTYYIDVSTDEAAIEKKESHQERDHSNRYSQQILYQWKPPCSYLYLPSYDWFLHFHK